MKKTFYTIACIALFTVVSNAQTATPEKKAEPAKEVVNPDGTVSTAPTLVPASAATEAPQDNSSQQTRKKDGGTRMAITEKGVPASKKPAEAKKAEPAKTEKH